MLFLPGLATLVYPPLQVVVGRVTTSAATGAGDPALMVGNELFILGCVLDVVAVRCFARRHGQLRGELAAGKKEGWPARLNGIQRTFNPKPRLLHHMRVNLRRGNVLMAEQVLNRADVIAVFQQMRRERMAQRVAVRPLHDAA